MLRTLAALVLVAAASTISGAGAEEPSADRQAALLHQVKHDCGSCHGLTLKGGLGPALLPESLAERSQAELAAVILEGVAGTPMPPWQGELTAGEAGWIARVLQEGLPQ